MERRAYILQDVPSYQEFLGINACRRAAWGKNGKDYYPYHAFSKRRSWRGNGELGKAIKNKNLFVALVKNEEGEVVAHAALVKNKFGIELGRVFSHFGGHGYGIEAVNKAKDYANAEKIDEIHIGVSYNRTAMWRAFEESFAKDDWKLAILGLLPDIYKEHDMQWGEIIARSVKEKSILLPKLETKMPEQLIFFAQGMQRLNQHCLEFAQQNQKNLPSAPYKFEKNLYGIGWNDYENQKSYIQVGYKPVGLIKINNEWHFVLHFGELPNRIEGKGIDLVLGKNSVVYPEKVAGNSARKVMDFIYG